MCSRPSCALLFCLGQFGHGLSLKPPKDGGDRMRVRYSTLNTYCGGHAAAHGYPARGAAYPTSIAPSSLRLSLCL